MQTMFIQRYHLFNLFVATVSMLGVAFYSAPPASATWMKKALESQKSGSKTTKKKAIRKKRVVRKKKVVSKRPASKKRSTTKRRAAAVTAVALQQAATKETVAAAKDADSGLKACSEGNRVSFKEANECTADKLEKLAEKLEKSDAVRKVSPKVIATLRTAAKKVRNARSRDEAIVALQSAKIALQEAILAGVEKGGKSEPGFGGKAGLSAVSGTLGKAISAVQREI